MTGFLERSAKHFVLIKAIREIKQEIEKAGLDNLKILADKGESIIITYLNGCALEEKTRIRHDLNLLLQVGITVDNVLDELTRQMPEIAPIIASKQGYKETETQKLEAFLKGV